MNARKIDGAKLKALRENRIMSPPEVASKADLHPVTILNIENGRCKTVHFGTVRKLALAFGMSPEEFASAVAVEEKVESGQK